MALKDWKKVKEGFKHKNKNLYLRIERWYSGRVHYTLYLSRYIETVIEEGFKDIKHMGNYRTKKEALAYAKSYMRKH